MIDTDDLDNMSRRDLVELLEAYNESLAEVKRLREGIRKRDTLVDTMNTATEVFIHAYYGLSDYLKYGEEE